MSASWPQNYQGTIQRTPAVPCPWRPHQQLSQWPAMNHPWQHSRWSSSTMHRWPQKKWLYQRGKKHWIQHFFWGSQPGSCRSQKWIVFLYVLLTMHCLWSLYRLFRSESAASPIKTGAWSTIAHASRRKNHQDCMAHHSSPQVPCWIQNPSHRMCIKIIHPLCCCY